MLPRRTFRKRIATLLALILGLCAVGVQAQTTGPPYTKEAIVGMLQGEVSPKRVAALARQRGIDFQITPQVESELRQAGATAELLATLREIAPKAPAPLQKPTEIVVQTSPGAEVYVDDQFVGRASPKGRLVVPNPRPGDHTVRVSLAGKRDYEQQVNVAAGQTSNVQPSLARTNPANPTGQVTSPDADSLYTQGLSYYNGGQWDLSIQCFQDYLKYYKDSANAQFYIGECYYRKGDYTQAIAAYDLCMERHPTNDKVAAAQLKKGFSLLALDQKRAGIRELRLLTQSFPDAHEAELARQMPKKLGISVPARQNSN